MKPLVRVDAHRLVKARQDCFRNCCLHLFLWRGHWNYSFLYFVSDGIALYYLSCVHDRYIIIHVMYMYNTCNTCQSVSDDSSVLFVTAVLIHLFIFILFRLYDVILSLQFYSYLYLIQ